MRNNNSIVTNVVHMSGSNSQALKTILSQCASQLNRLLTLPWWQPLKLTWTQNHGGVLNAGNDCLFGKLFRRGPVKTCHGGKYLHDVIQAQSSFLYFPKGLESICRVTGTEENSIRDDRTPQPGEIVFNTRRCRSRETVHRLGYFQSSVSVQIMFK